mgnify:CR=1 FL=1
MSQRDYTAEILGMEDVEIEKVVHTDDEIQIHFRKKRSPQVCPVCGMTTQKVHDYHTTVLRDIPILGAATRLLYRRRRYVCEHCGKRFPEPFPLAGKYQRTTGRLALFGLTLAKERRSWKSIAAELGVSASSVGRWMRYIPSGKPSSLPRVLSIDEYKGNAGGERFQCILTAPETRSVLDILPDRTAATIQDYLKTFANREEVEYFVMDMNRAYRDIALTFFPKAKIVIDRFHFVRYGVWAFENVRRRVQQSLSPAKRKYFKRSRKLLLSRADRLSVEDRKAVDVMLAHSEDLTRAWLLKEAFFRFVDARSSVLAKEALDHFRFCARSLKMPEFTPCLKMLRNWEQYILNAFDCPFNNGFTEGVNNATKTLKRATFGMPNFHNARARILFSFS